MADGAPAATTSESNNDVDLNNLAHLIAKEMLQKHLNNQPASTTGAAGGIQLPATMQQ